MNLVLDLLLRYLTFPNERAHLTTRRIRTEVAARARTRPAQLGRSFFEHAPDLVARQLLGKVLRRKYEGEWLSGRITEVEAYLGMDDPASHAFNGQTERNKVLFGLPGFAYVYLVYGIHYCLNVSCLPASGVLFRSMEPLEGLKTMARLSGMHETSDVSRISRGPGRLSRALGITRELHNGIDVTRRTSILQIVDDGCKAVHIEVTPRIGIHKAADLPLRFLITSNRRTKGGNTHAPPAASCAES